MMTFFMPREFPHLIIPDAGTESNAIEIRAGQALGIFSAAASTGDVSIEVSPDGENWYDHPQATLVDGAYTEISIAFRFVRLVSSVAEGAERVYRTVVLGG